MKYKILTLLVLTYLLFTACHSNSAGNSAANSVCDSESTTDRTSYNSDSTDNSSQEEITESVDMQPYEIRPEPEFGNGDFTIVPKTDLSLIPAEKVKVWLDYGESEAQKLYNSVGVDNMPIKITDVYISELDGAEIALVTYSNFATEDDISNHTVYYDTAPPGNKFMGYNTYELFINDVPYNPPYYNLFPLEENVERWIIGKDSTESSTFFVFSGGIYFGSMEVKKEELQTAKLWFYDEKGIPQIYNVYDPVFYGDCTFNWTKRIRWDISTGKAFDEGINVLSVNQIPLGISSSLAWSLIYTVDAENNSLTNVTNEWNDWKYN